MAFELLSPPIRKYVYDQGWESLRPIQLAAIAKILTTPEHYILASRTASGKTEAAFLPILSSVDFKEKGVQVLYVSPLVALINDQFERVEGLCNYLDVGVTKWHGEASRALKDKLLKAPQGVVLITPESIEAMLVNHPYQLKALFFSLKFIVIDEIHAFLGTDRGLHFQSLLYRITQYAIAPIRIVGLSATIGDYLEAKRFTGNEVGTKVLLDKTAKELEATFRYHVIPTQGFTAAFIGELYEAIKDHKALIFPNSRGKAEEIAVKLQQVSAQRQGHRNFFSHHASVDKEVREYVEAFAKSNQHLPFAIVCTSTLELGIDIGSVDIVVQIDSTFSVASLIQRIGRSGRRGGATSRLLLVATEAWALLQSLACWNLYQSGFIEPVKARQQPYDLAFHQLLSKLKETSGLRKRELAPWLKANYAFRELEEEAIHALIGGMVEDDYIEALGEEYILGISGEHLVNSRDFYSAFQTDPSIKILFQGKVLGEIPLSPQIVPDENIYLAAKIWKIIDVDEKAGKAEVIPAQDGKRPLFFGNAGEIHPRIREEMLRIVQGGSIENALPREVHEALQELKFTFKGFAIGDLSLERPVLIQQQSLMFYTFTGTRINRTLAFLFKVLGLAYQYREECSLFTIDRPYDDLSALLEEAKERIPTIEESIAHYLETEPATFQLSKWGVYLPARFKIEHLKSSYFDFSSTYQYLTDTILCYPSARELGNAA